MHKESICTAFSKQAHKYTENAYVQKESMHYLLEHLHNNENFDSILDIGTGTGTLLLELQNRYPNARLLCNDISSAMLEHIPNTIDIYAKICGDAEQISLPEASLYISHFAFQWFNNIELVIEKFSKQCNVLLFSTLLDSTFIEWKELCIQHGVEHSMYTYPSISSLQKSIDALGLRGEYTEKIFPLQYSSPREFIRYLKSIGASTPNIKAYRTIKPLLLLQENFFTTYHIAFIRVNTNYSI